MTEALRDTGAVLRRSLLFFLRRYPIIAAFGLLASGQRFLAVGGDERFAFAGGLVGEAFTLVVRLLFLVWLARTLLRAPEGDTLGRALRRGSESFRERPMFHVGYVVVLMIMLAIFKVGVDGAIALAVPEDGRQAAVAWELAIKNVTVIPFTLVWSLHHVAEMLYPARQRRSADAVPAGR